MCGGLYDFFRDQGSLVAGLMAVGAAWLAYKGAKDGAAMQVAALERQNAQLKTESRSALARRGIVAVNLWFGILKKIEDDIRHTENLLNQPQFFASREAAPPSWRKLIHRPGLEIIWQELGLQSPDFVRNYLVLDAKISDFADREINGVDYMKNVLAELTNVVRALSFELESDARRLNLILGDE